MGNVADINARKPPVCYSLHITHHWDGRIELSISGISENPTPRDKVAVLYAAREAVKMLEEDLEGNGKS